ncbi:MAG TPA: ABC transporter ATP-binding protein [Thermoanaerobaculia bacterium]|nr:ABC transporter ATP-binding protein [Thermoanaerobaculia bacterium]
MVEHVIDASNLRKTYDGVEALRGLDLEVPAGSISALVGCNGAGKTTLIKILMGMTRPASGSARIFGRDATSARESVEIRRRIGFASEEHELYDAMSVDEMLRFTAPFFPRWRSDLQQRYLRKFELPLQRKVKALSRGMRTKLALLLALSRGADLLILDEPTAGLDPAIAEEVLQALVSHVSSEELTVFFSSNQIAEVEQVADRVSLIHRGRAAVAGAIDDLRERYCRIQLVFDDVAPDVTFRAPGVARMHRHGRVLEVLSSNGSAALLDEVRALNPRATEVRPVSLKEIFLECVAVEE